MSIQPIRKHVAPEIPDKLYFRIGDVARLCEVPAYVLRFWETEFPQLRPNKGGTGQRLYRKRDVEMTLRIKSLLYDQGYTIPGARQVFKAEKAAREAAASDSVLPVPVMAPVATESAVLAPIAMSPQGQEDKGQELRQRAAWRAVRDELGSLLTLLEQPIGSGSQEPVGSANQERNRPAPRVQPLRPRLVLEPRPSLAVAETLRLVGDIGIQGDARAQRDLFPGE